jgi:hypothetical protein
MVVKFFCLGTMTREKFYVFSTDTILFFQMLVKFINAEPEDTKGQLFSNKFLKMLKQVLPKTK